MGALKWGLRALVLNCPQVPTIKPPFKSLHLDFPHPTRTELASDSWTGTTFLAYGRRFKLQRVEARCNLRKPRSELPKSQSQTRRPLITESPATRPLSNPCQHGTNRKVKIPVTVCRCFCCFRKWAWEHQNSQDLTFLTCLPSSIFVGMVSLARLFAFNFGGVFLPRWFTQRESRYTMRPGTQAHAWMGSASSKHTRKLHSTKGVNSSGASRGCKSWGRECSFWCFTERVWRTAKTK